MGHYEDALESARIQDVTGEQPDWELFDELTLPEIIEVLARAREEKRLANIVRSAAKLYAARELGVGNAITDGHTLYRYYSGNDRRVKDPVEFISWLGPDDAANVLNINAFSIERFRQCAASRGGDVKELEEHFFATTPQLPDLVEIPLTDPRAPKYAATMKPGIIRQGRKP